jgi:hypothetical protein
MDVKQCEKTAVPSSTDDNPDSSCCTDSGLVTLEEIAELPARRDEQIMDSSGVYICKSVVNYLRYGNYICKS